MATKMVQLTVPAGKFGGDVMVCECLDKRGKKQSVEVVIPLGLKPGATFSLPDPAESVTLHGIEASMYVLVFGANGFKRSCASPVFFSSSFCRVCVFVCRAWFVV